MKPKQSNPAERRIPLHAKNETVYVKPEQVTHLKCDGYISTVYCTNGKSYSVIKSLKSFEKSLSKYGFIRVNHNAIVNIDYIEKATHKERHTLQLCCGKEITVSRRRARELKELLG